MKRRDFSLRKNKDFFPFHENDNIARAQGGFTSKRIKRACVNGLKFDKRLRNT